MPQRIKNGVHELEVTVYYEDTDLSGFVYHANYLRFAERGRSEFLYDCGGDHETLKNGDPPMVFVIISMNIGFKAPAKIGDLLKVRTVYTKIKGARFEVHQKIFKDETLIWEADVVAATLTLDGRPRRLPVEFLHQITPNLADKELI